MSTVFFEIGVRAVRYGKIFEVRYNLVKLYHENQKLCYKNIFDICRKVKNDVDSQKIYRNYVSKMYRNVPEFPKIPVHF